MTLFFVVGIYFYARGVFALSGQTIFYTKRSLECIEEERIPAYLKESGICHMAVGTVFVAKALLDVLFPGSFLVMLLFSALLIACVFFLARCNEKYSKK